MPILWMISFDRILHIVNFDRKSHYNRHSLFVGVFNFDENLHIVKFFLDTLHKKGGRENERKNEKMGENGRF